MAKSIQHFITTAKARPPKVVRDYLSPTNSHLLSILLSDVLPPSCYPYPGPPQPATPVSLSNPLTIPPTPNVPAWKQAMPLGHHLVYFPLQARPSDLSWDGADDEHAPGKPYERRLWAGGKMVFREGWEGVMRLDGRGVVGYEGVGDVRVVERKESGGMVVVDLKRGYGVDGEDGVVVEEVRRLVFLRGEEGPKKPPMFVKEKPDYTVSLTPSPALLFGFSALTYNAHRIHIDPEYARSESHRAMLFHGPFSVVLLLTVVGSQLARGEAVRVFDYRNFRPLYVGEELRVCVRRVKTPGKEAGVGGREGGSWEVWIEGPDGGVCVKGTVTTAYNSKDAEAKL